MRLRWARLRSMRIRGARSSRRRLDVPLAVRRLERRRVLDASLAGLLANVSVGELDPDTVSVSTEDPAGAGSLGASWETQAVSAAASGTGTSALNGNGEFDNDPPVLVAALDQVANEGQLLDLSGVGGAPPLGLFIDDGLPGTHTATVDWGDGSGVQPIDDAMIFYANGSGALGGSHTYADEGLYTVTLQVTDVQGESGMRNFNVTVSNVRPVLVTALDQEVNEGKLLDLSGVGGAPPLGLFIDDGVLDTHTATVDWGDGSGVQMIDDSMIFFDNGSGAIGGSHTYLDNGDYVVKVTVSDGDGGSDMRSFDVTVNNVRPVLVVALDQEVNEGQLLDLSAVDGAPPLALFIDDGVLDTHTATVDWGDGSGIQLIDDAMIFFDNGSGALAGSHTYLDDGVYTVKVTVTDDDGGSDMRTFDVTVSNVPPVLVVALDQEINEGQLLNLSGVGGAPPLGLFIDEGVLDTHTATVDWGDGSGIQPIDDSMIFFADGSGAIGGTHTYLDDGVYTVMVTVTDDDGGSDMRTFDVTVKNVPPVLVVAADREINEGQLLNLSAIGGAPPLGLFIDDGVVDTHTATVDWGDGSGVQAIDPSMVFFADGSGAIGGSHTYADDGVYTVKVTVGDDDGGSDVRTFTVTVKNLPPMLIGTDDLMVMEGSAFTLAGLEVQLADMGFDNPDNPTLPEFGDPFRETFTSYTIDWGDGRGTSEPVTIDNVAGRVSGSPGVLTTATLMHEEFTYADDGVYTVTIRVADDNMSGDFAEGTDGVDFVELQFMITVKNEVPTLVAAANQTVNESDDLVLPVIASFTDPGFDNPDNPNGPTELITDPLTESFRYFIDWGDGRDQVGTMPVSDMNGAVGVASSGSFGAMHNYADDGVYPVTIRLADDNMLAYTDAEMFINGENGVDFVEQTFTVTVNNLDPSFVPMMGENIQGVDINAEGITTIELAFNDPGYDNPANPTPPPSGDQFRESFTVTIDWQDGTVDVIPVNLVAPGSPLIVNSQTTVVASMRTSGSATVLTTGSIAVQHRYFGPPDPLRPAADVVITVTVSDDNGGTITDSVAVSNPGFQEQHPPIIAPPDVPRLELGEPPTVEVILPDQAASAQVLQTPDVRATGGELTASNERYFQLHPVLPDGPDDLYYRIRDEALVDLRAFFQTLPDGRYEIHLFNSANNSRRFVIRVDVRQGRVIDVSDDSAGTRDRPPTDERPIDAGRPLEENPLLEAVPGGSSSRESLRFDSSVAESESVIDKETRRGGDKEEVGESGSPGLLVSLSPGLLALAAAGPWSQRVDRALAEADDGSWQRLRRAGRLGRLLRRRSRPMVPPAVQRKYNNV